MSNRELLYACGCRQPAKYGNTYIIGHNRKNYKILEWILEVLPTQQGTIYKRIPACFEPRYGLKDTLKLGNFIHKSLISADIYLSRKFILFQRIKKFASAKNLPN